MKTGAHMELQALRYAAMISTMSFAKACEYFQTYLKKQNCDADAKKKNTWICWAGWNWACWFRKKISELFWLHRILAKELTTTAIWLRDKGVDIRYRSSDLYRFNDDVLINAEQIIPVPELEEYQVKFREKRDEQLISSQKKKKDYTWYIYKDKELNKRKLALELLRDWIRQFNPASYNDLINGLSEDFKTYSYACRSDTREAKESLSYQWRCVDYTPLLVKLLLFLINGALLILNCWLSLYGKMVLLLKKLNNKFWYCYKCLHWKIGRTFVAF